MVTLHSLHALEQIIPVFKSLRHCGMREVQIHLLTPFIPSRLDGSVFAHSCWVMLSPFLATYRDLSLQNPQPPIGLHTHRRGWSEITVFLKINFLFDPIRISSQSDLRFKVLFFLLHLKHQKTFF